MTHEQLLSAMCLVGIGFLQYPVATLASEVSSEPLKTISPEIRNSLQGRVTDTKGAPVVGASVLVKGKRVSTFTDENGNFSINAKAGDVLKISCIGYQAAEVVVKSEKLLEVKLADNDKSLNEVLVVGYGVQKKGTLTGSVSSVQGEKLAVAPTMNFSNALAGRLPGLTVVTGSGEPGSDDATFRIRGANTLGDNAPLIVVDGVPNRDMNRLNPDDIENVSILKDASAAIYGSQAANGVILVTTKRGKAGKPQVNVSFNYGLSQPTVLPKTLDAASYLEIRNEVSEYAGQKPAFSEEEISNYRNHVDPWLYPDTDWYSATLKKAASQNAVTASIRGGSERFTYAISFGSDYQDGIYKNSANKYNQMNFRGNIDGKLNDYMKVSFNVAGRQENRHWPTWGSSSIFSALRRAYPYLPAYWPDGKNGPDISDGLNPVVVTTNQSGYNKKINYTVETKAAINITLPWVKGLSFDVSYAFDRYIMNQKVWETPYYLYSWDKKTYDEAGNPVLNQGKKGYSSPQLTQRMSDTGRMTANAIATYARQFGDHNIKIMAGLERIRGGAMNFEAFRKYFVSAAIPELFAGGDAEKDNTGSSSKNKRMNYFGRINYDYRSKYLAEFIWRVDGSYIFNRGKRYGFFPGVSLGWRMSEEDFWKEHLAAIDYFKLRGSWGQTGNDRISAYQYLASYGFRGDNYVFNLTEENKVLMENRIPNPNVTWEVANQMNIGFDGATFGNRLTFSAEYFYNWRKNILWTRNASVPGTSGLTLPRENIGKVDNQGFEITLGWNDHVGDFSYGVSVDLGYARNKIRFWDETPGVPSYQQSTGHPMPSSPGSDELYYNTIGVFKDQDAINNYPTWGEQYGEDGKPLLDKNGNKITTARPGDIIFEDVNKDGKIDGLDRIRVDKTSLPRFTGGLNVDLGYKGFYATMFFQWATGAVRYDYYEMEGESGNYLVNEVKNRWTPTNTNTNVPRAWNRYFEYWRNNRNTYWLHKTDYIRLKNMEIGYRLPKKWLSKMFMNDVRVYVSGMNLLTLTGVKDFDPESSSTSSYPLNRVYNVGISVTF